MTHPAQPTNNDSRHVPGGLSRTALRDKLSRGDWLARLPAGPQLTLLTELAALYQQLGVLDADREPVPLAGCCPQRHACWAGAHGRCSQGAAPLGYGADGSVFLPYVGADYRRAGVCMIAWNVHHDGSEWYGLAEELVIAEGSRDLLASGARRTHGSHFAYRSLSAGVAVDGSLRGLPPQAAPAPERVASDMSRLARLQAVKCSPLGERSNPADTMSQECPAMFLPGELAVLQPAAVVVFGHDALWPTLGALTAAHGTPISWRRGFHEGFGRAWHEAPWGELEIFALWHPSYRPWPRAQERLIRSLSRSPLHRRAA